MATALIADELTWVSGEPPAPGADLQARIRYRGVPAAATIEVKAGSARVQFEKPQRAVAPGQAVVLYDGERVLGGGTNVKRL